MNKNKIQLIITLSLIPILIAIVYRNIAGAKVKKTISKVDVQRQAAPLETSTKEDRMKKVKDLGWTRDPFLFGEIKNAEGGLVLNGIVWDERVPSAIINDTVVRIGDEVGGNRIVDIQKERVIINKEGNTYELNLRRGGG